MIMNTVEPTPQSSSSTLALNDGYNSVFKIDYEINLLITKFTIRCSLLTGVSYGWSGQGTSCSSPSTKILVALTNTDQQQLPASSCGYFYPKIGLNINGNFPTAAQFLDYGQV